MISAHYLMLLIANQYIFAEPTKEKVEEREIMMGDIDEAFIYSIGGGPRVEGVGEASYFLELEEELDIKKVYEDFNR